jgi:glycosyltransferase involved in cell wall biosynthesis
MKTFAAIIPIHNGAKFIDKCLSSILDQSRRPDEIILVNDDSKDETQEKIDEWCSRNATIKSSQIPRIGVSGARNHGAMLARSDNLMFLDVDDQWLPGKIRTHEEHLIQHPSCSFSFSLSQTVECKRNLVIKKDSPQSVEPTLFNILTHAYQIQGSSSSVCVDRVLFNSLGGFQIGLARGEDWEFWVRCAQSFPPCEIKEILVSVFLRPNSVEHTSLSGIQNFYSTSLHLQVWDKHHNYLANKDFAKYASKILFADLRKNKLNVIASYSKYKKIFTESGDSVLKLIGIKKANFIPIKITLLYIRYRVK